MFDFLALFSEFGEVRAGRGHLGSRSSARYQGQSHQPRHPPRWHRFACGRAFLFGFHGRFERPLRRFPLGFPLFFLQPREVSAGWSATGQALTWVSIEQSCTTARSGDRNIVGNTVCGHGSCCSVRRKEAGTALHSDARESCRSWCRPVSECLVMLGWVFFQVSKRSKGGVVARFRMWPCLPERPPEPLRRTRHSFAKHMPTFGWTP